MCVLVLVEIVVLIVGSGEKKKENVCEPPI